MEKITSKDNKNIKEYVKLRDSKSYRSEKGLFVIESIKLILEALNSGIFIEKVFVTQSCFDENFKVLQKLFDMANVSFIIPDNLENKLSLTSASQGVFAVCKTGENIMSAAKLKKSGKYIFLNRLQDTGNVGTIVRTAEALGADGIIISKDSCDILSLKVLRASMGSAFRMKIFISDDTLTDLKEYNKSFATYAAVLDADALTLGDIAFCENSIIVIGNEGNGLENEVIKLCKHKLTIKMNGKAESLNAAMATGLLIWEMTKK